MVIMVLIRVAEAALIIVPRSFNNNAAILFIPPRKFPLKPLGINSGIAAKVKQPVPRRDVP